MSEREWLEGGSERDWLEGLNREEVCGKAEACCACKREEGHEGEHRCDCGGTWTYDEAGKFVPLTIPGSAYFDDIFGGVR